MFQGHYARGVDGRSWSCIYIILIFNNKQSENRPEHFCMVQRLQYVNTMGSQLSFVVFSHLSMYRHQADIRDYMNYSPSAFETISRT